MNCKMKLAFGTENQSEINEKQRSVQGSRGGQISPLMHGALCTLGQNLLWLWNNSPVQMGYKRIYSVDLHVIQVPYDRRQK